jgi:hypothetical protein
MLQIQYQYLQRGGRVIDRLQPKVVDRGSSLCMLAEEDPAKMAKAGTSRWRTLLGVAPW